MEKMDLQDLVDQGILQKDPDIALVKDQLRRLVEGGFIRSLAGQYFEFDNNLTWEVVYQTILYAERRHMHTLVAKHIEKANEKNLENVSDVLAYHYKQAGDAVNYVWYTALSGKRAADMYANNDAVTRFEEALTTIQSLDERCYTDLSLIDEKLGDVFESSGKYTKAIERYILSLNYWKKDSRVKRRSKYLQWKVSPSSRNAHLCWRIAVAAEHDSQFDTSLTWLEKAEDTLPTRPGRLNAQICATRSAVLFRKGDYAKAMEEGRKSLRFATKSGEKRDIAYANNILANTHITSGQFSDAIKHLRKAVNIYEEIEDYSGVAAANSNLGSCFQNLGDLMPAIKYFDLALSADQKIQNKASIAMDQFNLGNALLDAGRYEMSISNMNEVLLAYADGNCPPDLAGAAWALQARCKLEMNELVEAEKSINKGIDMISQTGQLGLDLAAHLIKAEILLAKGMLAEAVDVLHITMKSIAEVNAKPLQALAERIYGSAMQMKGQVEEAIEHIQNSLAISREVGIDYEWAIGVITLGEMLSEEALATKMIKDDILSALQVFEKIGHQQYIKKAMSLLGQ